MRWPSLALPVRELMLIAAVPVAVLIAFSFARVLVAEYQIHLQKQQLEADIRALQAENQQLQARVTYLQTDAAVEELAREELGWTKPGDTAVVIIRAIETAQPTAPPNPSPTKASRG